MLSSYRPRGNEKVANRGKGFARGRGGTAKANVTRVTSENGVTIGETHVGTGKSGFPNLSSNQWATLLDLLNQCKSGVERLSGKNLSNEWIIDSGASHHMTGDLTLLSDVSELNPIQVGLPDGSVAVASKEGNMLLENGFSL